MKRFAVLFGLLILILFFGTTYAQFTAYGDFDLEIEPGNTFVHPDDGLTYYKANTNLYLDIKIGNNSGMDITGFGELFRFYAEINGVETDAVPINWIDAGNGGDLGSSLDRMNGWEDETYFGMLNEVAGFGWDGNLPDSMSHYTASMTGWPDGDPTLTRYRFYFSVLSSGFDPETDVVELCIDEYDCTGYDCEGMNIQGFDGPHCYKFLNTPFVEPALDYVPPTLTTTHDESYFVTLNVVPSEFNLITGAGAIDEFGNPIGFVTSSMWVDQIQWNFTPPCEWVNDGLTHTVNFYLEDETHDYLYPDVTLYTSELIVTEGAPPVITGDCGSSWFIPIRYTGIFEFDVTNRNEEDFIWSYSIFPSIPDGNVELIDGTLSFKPCPSDEVVGLFIFSVRATDCTGEYAECNATFEVGSMVIADPNFDGEWNILDAVLIINYLYKDGPLIYPPFADWNWDGNINILDVVYIINFLYKDGPIFIFPPLDC